MLLVIFGAGASYDSYGGWTGPMESRARERFDAANPYRPPLTRDLFEPREPVINTTRLLPECGPWVAYMRDELKQRQDGSPATDSVESILARLQASADANLSKRATLAIRLFLQRMLTECQDRWSEIGTANVTNYGALLAQIAVAGVRAACFVTFNYDTLLEQSLPAIGFRIDRLDAYVTHPAFKLIKPHGSLSWAHGITSQSGALLSPQLAVRWLIDHAPEIQPQSEFQFMLTPELGATGAGVALWPALALPVATKSDFECPPDHLDVLKACLPQVTRVLTIGWRGAEQHFLPLLAEHLRADRGLVVGKDQAEAQTICAGFKRAGLPGWSAANAGFTESLKNREIQHFLAS